MAMRATIATQDAAAGRGGNREADPTKRVNGYLSSAGECRDTVVKPQGMISTAVCAQLLTNSAKFGQ
jgi:hypothetical protein